MLVFDAFSPSNATEIMELATKLASENPSTEENPPSAPVTTEKLKESEIPQTNTALETTEQGNQAKCSGKLVNLSSFVLSTKKKHQIRNITKHASKNSYTNLMLRLLSTDMRYPRRASLLKFLEKRKERYGPVKNFYFCLFILFHLYVVYFCWSMLIN